MTRENIFKRAWEIIGISTDAEFQEIPEHEKAMYTADLAEEIMAQMSDGDGYLAGYIEILTEESAKGTPKTKELADWLRNL